MANKTIYICDCCGSYADIKDMYKVTFGSFISFGISPSRHPDIFQADLSKERELCFTCVKELGEKFNLNATKNALTESAFKGFSLPEIKP